MILRLAPRTEEYYNLMHQVRRQGGQGDGPGRRGGSTITHPAPSVARCLRPHAQHVRASSVPQSTYVALGEGSSTRRGDGLVTVSVCVRPPTIRMAIHAALPLPSRPPTHWDGPDQRLRAGALYLSAVLLHADGRRVLVASHGWLPSTIVRREYAPRWGDAIDENSLDLLHVIKLGRDWASGAPLVADGASGGSGSGRASPIPSSPTPPPPDGAAPDAAGSSVANGRPLTKRASLAFSRQSLLQADVGAEPGNPDDGDGLHDTGPPSFGDAAAAAAASLARLLGLQPLGDVYEKVTLDQ